MKKLIPIYAVVSLIMCYFLEAYLWNTWFVWEIPSPAIKMAVFLYLFMLIWASIIFYAIDYAGKKQKEAEEQAEEQA